MCLSIQPIISSDEKNIEERMYRRLIRIDARIRNQFDLISSRTGWLLTSHAFLLTALAATVNAMYKGNEIPALVPIRSILLLTLPLIGIVTSALVWKSVKAAYAIVDQLKPVRKILLIEMADRFAYELTDGANHNVMAGDRPPKIFPWVMACVWLVLLFSAFYAINNA